MSNVFFLSYARPPEEDDAHLAAVDQFFQDLRRKVAEKVAARDSDVGFRDARDLVSGTPDWVKELKEKLIAFPVGVVLLSPWYLSDKSPWCKWEHQFLANRNQWAESHLEGKPKLMLVVDWVKPNVSDIPADYPSGVQNVQESIAGDDPAQREAVRKVLQPGLRETIDLIGKDDGVAARYRQFVSVLASYIVGQWRIWDTASAGNRGAPHPPEFHSSDTWNSPQGHTNAKDTPRVRIDVPSKKKVIVVYIAAQPHEVGERRAWRYVDDGESDWKAFACEGDGGANLDGDQRVGSIVGGIPEVEVERLHFKFFSREMADQLVRVGMRYPVIFIVDPWTVTQIDEYRSVLVRFAKLESRLQAFTCPMVIWNDNEEGTRAIRAEFANRVGNLFDKYRWEEVLERDEFAACLTSAVKRLQRMIRNARADLAPPNGGPPPRINPAPAP